MVRFYLHFVLLGKVLGEPFTSKHDCETLFLNLGVVSFGSWECTRGKCHGLAFLQEGGTKAIVAGITLQGSLFTGVIVLEDWVIEHQLLHLLQGFFMLRWPEELCIRHGEFSQGLCNLWQPWTEFGQMVHESQKAQRFFLARRSWHLFHSFDLSGIWL